MDTKQLSVVIFTSAVIGGVCGSAAVYFLGTPETGVGRADTLADQRISRLELELSALQQRNDSALRQNSLALEIDEQAGTGVTLESEAPELQIADVDNLVLSEDEQRAQFQSRLQPEYQRQQLVEAGLSEQDAALIVRTESDLALERLRDDHMNRRQYFEQLQQEGTDWFAKHNPLRAKLGDERYELYLKARNYPTEVQIGSIMAASPGELAGLAPGDSIQKYDGRRVFNGRDLNDLTAQGALGQNVMVEITRDDETMFVTIPRGPIGISTGGRRFRR